MKEVTYLVTLDLWVEAPNPETAAASFLDIARDSNVIVAVEAPDGRRLRIDTEDYSIVTDDKVRAEEV